MLAAIRLRGDVKTPHELRQTCLHLGLKRKNSLVLLSDTPSIRGMLRRAESHITWGEAGDELVKKVGKEKVLRLKPPQKGFKSIKTSWPKGDVGYRGDKINDLAKRMLGEKV